MGAQRRRVRLERVEAIDFGPVVDLDIELNAGLNIIVGPNASGKSYRVLAAGVRTRRVIGAVTCR